VKLLVEMGRFKIVRSERIFDAIRRDRSQAIATAVFPMKNGAFFVTDFSSFLDIILVSFYL
jgi:hypothetical protein